MLDNVLRYLNLTTIDAMDPRVPRYAPNSAPALGRPAPNGQQGLIQSESMVICPESSQSNPQSKTTPSAPAKYTASLTDTVSSKITGVSQGILTTRSASVGCPCQALCLAVDPEASRCTPEWWMVPRWGSNETWGDIRKEEARRLVWSSVFVLSGDALTRLARGAQQLDLHLSRPENVRCVDIAFLETQTYPRLAFFF